MCAVALSGVPVYRPLVTTPTPVLVLVDEGYFGHESLQAELGARFDVRFATDLAEALSALATLEHPLVLAPRALEPLAGDALLAELAARGQDFLGALMLDDDIDHIGEGVHLVIRRPLGPGALRLQLQAAATQRARLLAARASAVRLAADLGRLADGLRHDLRGQLQSVVGLASLVLELERPRRAPDDELIDFVTRINAAGDRLTRFADALGDWLAAARRPFERAAVDLVDLAREVIARVRAAGPSSTPGSAPPPEMSFELVDASVLVARAEGDPRMLQRALEVLVERAAANARPVRVTLDRTPEGWALSVYDVFARPIPESHHERVFDLFEKVGGGDGVGLAFVKKVAERHGASVRLAPHAAGGHEVVLTLPWVT